MKKLILALTVLVGFSVAKAQTTWTIDKSHSTIGFNVTHLVISEVDGKFNEFDAKVTSTSEDFAGSEVEFTAQVASIDTDNEQRDNHLKSADFFDAENNPTVSFKGKIEKAGTSYKLVGKLTMRGTTKDVTFDVKYNGTIKDPWGNIKSGFKITGTVNRKEYGLKWGALTEAGGAVVSDEVEIVSNIELQKQS